MIALQGQFQDDVKKITNMLTNTCELNMNLHRIRNVAYPLDIYDGINLDALNQMKLILMRCIEEYRPIKEVLVTFVMTRGNRRSGVNLGPRDPSLTTLFPVVLRVGASGVKLARRAAP